MHFLDFILNRKFSIELLAKPVHCASCPKPTKTKTRETNKTKRFKHGEKEKEMKSGKKNRTREIISARIISEFL